MPALAGPALIGAAAGWASVGTVGAGWAALVGAGVAAGTWLLGKVLKPRQRSQYDEELPQNTSSPVRPVAYVLGKPKVAGNKVRSTQPGSDEREIIVSLGEGPCQAIHNVEVDDVGVDVLLGGAVVAFRSGDPAVAPPDADDFPLFHAGGDVQRFAWTSTLWVRLQHENYTRNGATITGYVEGLACWDTLFSSRTFSRNPARIATTFLAVAMGVPIARINAEAFLELENYCDIYGDENEQWSEDLTGGGTITASSSQTGSSIQQIRGPSNVLVSNGQSGVWATERTAPPHWLQYDFGDQASVRVGRFQLTGWRDYFPTTFAFQGSDDAVAWTTLNFKEDGDPSYASSWSGSWSDYEEKTFLVDPVDVERFRYYRLYITAQDGEQCDIARLKLFAKLGAIAPRHRFDYIVDTLRPPDDVLRMIGESFRGRLIESQGKWKPVWLRPKTAADYTFDMTNIVRGSFQDEDGESPNVVRVIFRNTARGGRQDQASASDAIDVARRGEFPQEYQYDWVTDREIALREAQFLFDKERRYPGRAALRSILAAAAVEEFDVVDVDHPVLVDGPKRYYVEDITSDEFGLPTFELRRYGIDIFHGRLATDVTPSFSEPSESIESIQQPVAPEEPTPTRGVGSASVQWNKVPGAAYYLVETRLVSVDGATDSGWRDPVEVHAASYTYKLTPAEIATYGNDAQIQFRITAVNRWGFNSEVSPAAAVTILPPDGAEKHKDFIASAGVTTYAIGQSATPGSATLAVEGGLIFNEKRDAGDLYYDFTLTESTPASGNYNQVELENELPDGAKFRLYFVPANNTYAAV